MLPMGGLLATLAAVVVVLLAVGGTVQSSGDATREDDSGGAIEPAFDDPGGGGTAAGICVEGVTDCVDTIVDPDGNAADCPDGVTPCNDVGGDIDPDKPVSSDPSAPGDVAPDSGSGAGGGSTGSAGGIEPAQPPCQGTDSDECAKRVTELALADLSARLGVEVEAITFVDSAYTEWPDACLGAAPAGTACATVITPGYVVILAHADVEYEYHTDLGSWVVLVVDGEPVE
jgi:hypothetical protein